MLTTCRGCPFLFVCYCPSGIERLSLPVRSHVMWGVSKYLLTTYCGVDSHVRLLLPRDRSWISALSTCSLSLDRHTHAIAAAVLLPALQLPRPPVAAERHACARLDADDERRHQREHRQGEPQGRVSHSKRALRRASSPAALRASSSAPLCAAVSSPLRLLSSASCRRCSFACCCAVPSACSSLPSMTCLLWVHAI